MDNYIIKSLLVNNLWITILECHYVMDRAIVSRSGLNRVLGRMESTLPPTCDRNALGGFYSLVRCTVFTVVLYSYYIIRNLSGKVT